MKMPHRGIFIKIERSRDSISSRWACHGERSRTTNRTPTRHGERVMVSVAEPRTATDGERSL